MIKKYLLCLFFTILFASASLWACAESLMMDKQQLDERTLRELASSSRYMLSRASLIAYVSGSQTVNTKHILLAALTRVESSDEKLNYLNDTDIIDETPTFNALGLILKELKILREVQEFLLSQLDIQVRDSLSFELNYNDLLILHLEDISSVPNLMYDESAIAFFERAVQEKEEEIRYMRNNSGNKTFFIPTFPEHFFLAAFSVDTGMSHFLSELLNKPPIKIKEDLFHKIEQARQTLLSISKRSYYLQSQEEKEIITLKLETLFADHPEGLTFKQIKAKIPEFANISDETIRNRLKENGYETQGRGRGALWNQQGHQTKKDEEKTIITRKLESLFADHPGGLTFKQIKAKIPEFANISNLTIYKRLKENGYEAQGLGPGALWNHQQGYQTKKDKDKDKEKTIISHKLEALFADHPGGLTFKQIKAKIPEFDNISDGIIRRRLRENGYEAQGRGPGALWNHQQGHQTRQDEEKARLRRKLEALFADHPVGLTFKQIKDAGITEFANISNETIHRRLRENGYEAQGRGPGALWNHQQGHQTRQDEEKARLRRKLEALFADHPVGLTFKQIKDAGITEFANISNETIHRRLRENGYEAQGRGPGALWNHQQGHQKKDKDKEKAIISHKLEALFADHPVGLTFKQIKDAGITEFANISDETIRNRLKENGYEAQGLGPGALWNHQQGHQKKDKDKEKAIISHKLEALFANHPGGLTFKQIKAEIPEFANMSNPTINRRLKENGYEAQGRGPGALWNHQQGYQTKKDEEKTIITRKLEALFADHPGGLTFKQIKDAGITEFANISDRTINRRLRENGYEAQGRGPGALWKKKK